MRLGSGTFAACCVVVEVLGVVLFLRGFFPAPVRSSSSSKHQAEPPAPEPSAGASSNWTKLPPPLFSKVVIVLIDALRDDFVFGSKGVKFMPYTTYLVEKGASHSFVAEAKPPTVTMPRIKLSQFLLDKPPSAIQPTESGFEVHSASLKNYGSLDASIMGYRITPDHGDL
uniref:Phosphatidylinositol glycan anchor biosynthesis class G n=1 Tax=Equus caballus TaxID=9796 RepID=A0A9L0TIH0_HORSE